MLTFQSDGVTVDVEVTAEGLIGQLLPPGPAGIEVLTGPREHVRLTADDMGRFTGEARPPVRSRCGCGPAGRWS